MATSFIRSRARMAMFGLVSALLAATTMATPTSAAGPTPFSATFPDEVTTARTCPAGVPAGAFCFTGVGHGVVTPPGSTGTEQFAGFVDLAKTDPITHCAPDYNVVSITTSQGTLFLTTAGIACLALGTESGTWRAVGGTGIFQDATGSGPVSTTVTGGNGSTIIDSTSTYGGTLILH